MVEQENEAAEAAETVAAEVPQADDAQGNVKAEPTEVVEATESAPSESAEDADAGADPSESAEEPVAAEAEQAEPAQDVDVAAADAGEGEKPAEKPAGKPAGKRRPRKSAGKPRRALEDITIGEKVNGRVVGLAKFGAFVDIGAKTDGLVHITQFPGRPKTVEEVVKSGDPIDVWVKEVDLNGGRISLTMKEPVQNPIGSLLPGSVVQGTVTSVAKYGVFVDISSDTEGLVHISEMSSGYVSQPEDIAKPGDTVEVRIKEIDAGQRRISLSMVGLANDSGGGEGMPSAAADDYVPDPEPDEPVPTVVELALRKALGDDDSDSTTAGGEKRGKGAGRTDMADLYARMIEDYKQTKAREAGEG